MKRLSTGAVWMVGVALLGLHACGDDDDSPPRQIPRGVTLSQLTTGGSYRAACQPLDGSHATAELTLNPDSTVIFNLVLYSDAACVQRQTGQAMSGRFDLVEEGTRLNLTAENGVVTPYTDEATAALNAEPYCGFQWVTGEVQDLRAGTCWNEVRTANWELMNLGGTGQRIQVTSREDGEVFRLILDKAQR